MLVGLILRHYKNYTQTVFVPISNKDNNFTGIMGANGSGKSAILESLDCFFNEREFNVSKDFISRSRESLPFIMPIFLEEDIEKKYKVSDDFIRSWKSDFVSDKTDFIINLSEKYDKRKYSFIFGIKLYQEDEEGKILEILPKSISGIFNEQENIKEISEVNNRYLVNKYNYIYIPVETDDVEYTKISNHDMGRILAVSNSSIFDEGELETFSNNITESLDRFFNEFNEKLKNYNYTPKTQRKNYTKRMLIDSIFRGYLTTKILKKESSGDSRNDIEIDNMSAGEKRIATLSVVLHLLENSDVDKNTIIAIDEPESSLDLNKIYDMFESIFKFSRDTQTLITTHWYGFLPLANKGIGVFVENQKIEYIKMDDPYDEYVAKNKISISIKSEFDFMQSIVSNIIIKEDFKLIICEGLTDKRYIDRYLKELGIDTINTLSVKGVTHLTKYYNMITNNLSNTNDEIKGKLFLLSDTDDCHDASSINKVSKSEVTDKIQYKRLAIDDKNGIVVLKDSTKEKSESRAIDIEESISSKDFKTIINKINPDVLKDVPENEDSKYGFNAYDLRESERKSLNEFTGSKENKIKMAEEIQNLEKVNIPDWFNEIVEFLEGKKENKK